MYGLGYQFHLNLKFNKGSGYMFMEIWPLMEQSLVVMQNLFCMVVDPNLEHLHNVFLFSRNGSDYTLNSSWSIYNLQTQDANSINIADGITFNNTNGNSVHVTSSDSVGGSKGTSPCNCIYPDAYSQELTTTSAVEFRTGNSIGYRAKVNMGTASECKFWLLFLLIFRIDNVHADASDCGTDLDHISSASYYDFQEQLGTENAKVKIGWYTNDQVDDYVNSLLLAHYDGSVQWHIR